jgi:hypothetical protein
MNQWNSQRLLSITLHILLFDSVVLAAAYQVDETLLSATEKKNKKRSRARNNNSASSH